MADKQRHREADENAGEDIGRVVGADDDPAEANDNGGGEEHGPSQAVEQENCECDRECGARVVAWEGRVVRPCSPDVCGGVRRERAGPVPYLRDELVCD
jgi:hypothetical protein